MAIGVSGGTLAVARTEAGERDVEAALSETVDAHTRVAAGTSVVVEVCAVGVAAASLPVPVVVEAPNARGESSIVAVLTVGAATLGAARRNGESACWTPYEAVAAGAGVVRAHLVDAEGAAALHLVARIHVRGARPASARPSLLIALLGALGLAAALLMARAEPPMEQRARRRLPAFVALFVGVVGAAFVGQAVRYLGDGSALSGLARGLVLGGAEVLLALGLAVRLAPYAGVTTASLLGLERPRGGAMALLLTPAVGALCAIAGVAALRLVPSSGGAVPIETFVARPSGLLAFAVLALVVPIAEELFFRGLVYGAAERALGAPAAFALSVGTFLAAHAPQDWGSWGGLTAVALVGVATTTLRATTRSVAVPMLAHLVYNALLTASAL